MQKGCGSAEDVMAEGSSDGGGDDSDEYQQGTSSEDSDEDSKTGTAALIPPSRSHSPGPQQSVGDNLDLQYASPLSVVVGVYQQNKPIYWRGLHMLIVTFWLYHGHHELGDIQMAVSL